jgi:hypothetical protein
MITMSIFVNKWCELFKTFIKHPEVIFQSVTEERILQQKSIILTGNLSNLLSFQGGQFD